MTAVLETTMRLDARAPAAARAAVAGCLRDLVAEPDLHAGQLIVTELVTNSLAHSGGPDGDRCVVSVEVAGDWVRIGVQDSGSDAVIAARPEAPEDAGGFGLRLVKMLSERWGVERIATGGTLVWAQLRRRPAGAGRGAGAAAGLDAPRAA